MTDFDYGNARLHAWKSRLLSKRELETLAGSGSQQSLITALTKTAYRKSVEAALARAVVTDYVSDALCNDLVNGITAARSFFDGNAGENVAIVLRRYDVHNLKAILRGVARHAPADQILSALLPVGDVKYSQFLDLVRASEPREAIDLIASMGLPVSMPLIKTRSEHPGAGEFEIELALDQWYYRLVFEYMQASRLSESVLGTAFKLDADLTNLLTAIRFVATPAEHHLLHEQLGIHELARLFVGPGSLPFATLSNLGSQNSLDAAVELLSKSSYGPTLRAGLKDYLQSKRLSDFEKHLGQLRLDWMARQIPRDPLGIGVFLGYLALKINEVNNLRWVTQGIRNGLGADTIRKELVYSQ